MDSQGFFVSGVANVITLCWTGLRAFWRAAASDPARDLYRKKFDINPQDSLMTAGSCFAQHIARTLRHRGYNVLDAEPIPPMLPEDSANKFGYNLYSARYGNIYTARQLQQLLREAFGRFEPKNWIWQKGIATSMRCDRMWSPMG